MNRRSFISSLLTAATALTLDPERLLRVPGAKTIFAPPPLASFTVPSGNRFMVGDIIIPQEVPASRKPEVTRHDPT